MSKKLTTKEFCDLVEPGLNALIAGKKGKRRLATAVLAHIVHKLRELNVISD